MKCLLAMLLSAALALSLAACGNNQRPDASSPESTASQASPSPQTSSHPTQSTENSGNADTSKILIAYFAVAENSGVDAVSSASYTTINGANVGRVRALADMIQAQTDGDLFSIQTSVVYPTNGEALIDFAADEQDKSARPELTSQIENLDQYDTVFVGYPTWWYDLPQVMYSFFDAYDFSGKTIIPFNTHNGSRFSSTIGTIQELEPDATVITEGFTVNERDVADAAGDVADWLAERGY